MPPKKQLITTTLTDDSTLDLKDLLSKDLIKASQFKTDLEKKFTEIFMMDASDDFTT
jgi:hypothetical protein